MPTTATYTGPLPRGRVMLPSGERPFTRGEPIEVTDDDAGTLDDDWELDTSVPGTVAALRPWIAGDPARARTARDVELARPRPRPTVLAAIDEVLATDPTPATDPVPGTATPMPEEG